MGSIKAPGAWALRKCSTNHGLLHYSQRKKEEENLLRKRNSISNFDLFSVYERFQKYLFRIFLIVLISVSLNIN